jgi:hypothetical protein
MKSLKILSLVLFLLSLSSSLFAQSSANANATVTVQLKKGVAITNDGGSLDFGEIVHIGSDQDPIIDPVDGVRFEVLGHPGRDVTVTFVNATLDNDAWAIPLGAPQSTLTFVPDVEETQEFNVYASGAPATVTTGTNVTLVSVTGTGTLYLWTGGTINIVAAQVIGDYTGTFIMNVAY